MVDARPDPDALLASVKAEEARAKHGKLKIFFGACAGVGKTYAMLEAAQKRKKEGFDVVAGIVVTHGRKETEALLQGLEVIPPKLIEYQGARLREFDLETALQRRPAIILVDELAHTNIPGSMHAKRWQDVQELLDAGIDVFSTMNVQHVESQNDVVAQITGVIVRETVPDSVLERAHEVEVVDLPPDDLLQRLKEGRVYVPEQAELARGNFFKKGNLIALRQLALRFTADRVDKQMERYRQVESIREAWPVAERILVCVGPSPQSGHVVRAAKRLANRLHAEWVAVYVETPGTANLPEGERERVLQNLRLAEQLGAEPVTLTGLNLPDTIAAYARQRNATKIVIGKPLWRTWRDVLFGSQVDQLARRSGDVDVFVIRGEAPGGAADPLPVFRRTSPWSAYGWSAFTVVLCTLAASLMLRFFNFSAVNLVMVYLAGVVFVATRFGRGPSVLASVLSVAAFDFFLVEPYLTFAVSDTQYIVTFAVMLLSALVISTLAGRVRQQAETAVERERRASALYALGRQLAAAGDTESILRIAKSHIDELIHGEIVFFLPDGSGRVLAQGGPPPPETEAGTAQWVFDHKQRAGAGTSTLPGSRYIHLPLFASNHTVGVASFRPKQEPFEMAPGQLIMLETLATLTAQALERERLARQSGQARVEVETERLRNALLSSVSHDLRTPLAGIKAASSLLNSAPDLEPVLRNELIQGIHEEADYINRLVGNLLEMTRLEAGAVSVAKEWQPLEEVIGSVTGLLESRLKGRDLKISIPDDCPMVPVDAVLIQQVLFNLIENALKYTPPATPIELNVLHMPGEVVVEVADRGPGLKAGEEGRIFDKFYRANSDAKRGGVGLGLTICKGIVSIHGGRIWAENRAGGGAVFRFTLPIDGKAPELAPAEPA
ncbi:MAG: sensor histidine kinase KdpD [Planctomycetes bacterium]|nr:sensor histidine kinase KdpD [Planctomycetota bacterium]